MVEQTTSVGQTVTLIVPTVHLNGTSGPALLEQLREAHRAGEKFLDVLAQAAPHGRDYYPQGADAYPRARKEHEARLSRVHAVLLELEAVMNKIDECVP